MINVAKISNQILEHIFSLSIKESNFLVVNVIKNLQHKNIFKNISIPYTKQISYGKFGHRNLSSAKFQIILTNIFTDISPFH